MPLQSGVTATCPINVGMIFPGLFFKHLYQPIVAPFCHAVESHQRQQRRLGIGTH